MEPRFESVIEARARISSHLLLPTPLLETSLSKNFPARCLLKLETRQPTGSFKVRPALNGMLVHLDAARKKGVLASSSGNFAQAVAWAAQRLGCSSHIVMTSSTSPYKVARTRDLGAEITLCEPTFKARWDTTWRLQEETGRVLLHPYDSAETIAGNGTIGLEIAEQLGNSAAPTTVLVPVSGGGLLAGLALALKNLPLNCRVIGVQQKVSASLKRSLDAGKRVTVPAFTSVADALVALTPGELPFGIIRRHVDDVVLVEDDEIIEAVRLLDEEQGLIAEPAGAVSLAALLSGALPVRTGENLVCIVSGANRAPDFFSAKKTGRGP